MAGRRRNTAANAVRVKPLRIQLGVGWPDTPEECVTASCIASDEVGEPFLFETAGDNTPEAVERILQELSDAGHGRRSVFFAGTVKVPGPEGKTTREIQAIAQRARPDEMPPERPVK